MKTIEGEDGVTHINVYSKGKTDLGKWLSNFSYAPITTLEHGTFNSIEGYWYWLKTGDDRLRGLYGYNAKKIGKETTLTEDIFTEDFIKSAIDMKLKTYPARMFELAQSSLPLTHYYDYGGKRVDAGYKWIIEHIELRRQQLKEFYKIS